MSTIILWLIVFQLVTGTHVVRLFEDGYVQFFEIVGFGFCLLPALGCSV